MQIIEIDGKKYMPKPQKQTSRSGSTGKLLMAAMTLATPYDPYVGIDRFFKKRPAVDIAAEYQLIQQKNQNYHVVIVNGFSAHFMINILK